MQLEPFFKIFGQDKVFTLTFEELTSQPEKTVKKIMSWLGVSDELCFQKTILKKT
jgi:phosphoglycerol transferase MdoB-like AlkP superfamily enzyme